VTIDVLPVKKQARDLSENYLASNKSPYLLEFRRRTTKTSTRREFFHKGAVLVSVATFIPAHVLGREEKPGANEKISLGIIGIGPRCSYDLTAMLPFADNGLDLGQTIFEVQVAVTAKKECERVPTNSMYQFCDHKFI
jgi:hypothetical protein